MSGGGLSDVLRDMAEGNHAKPAPGAGQTTPGRPPTGAAHDDLMPGEIDDESGEVLGVAMLTDQPTAFTAGNRPAARTPSRHVPRGGHPDGLKAIMLPVFGTVGLLLLIPGVWALLILGGVEALVPEGRAIEDAQQMAYFMLIALPMALILLAAAGYNAMVILNNRNKP